MPRLLDDIKRYIEENPEVMRTADDLIDVQDWGADFASDIQLKDIADEDLHDFVEYTIVHAIATGGKTTPAYAHHEWILDAFIREVHKISTQA